MPIIRLAKVRPPVTAVGTLRSVVVPSPSVPWEFDPRQ
jgi:hypothetical protein